ncbi:hypothetical protein DSM112329_03497 [Paraconexibacter sp. AEG42_29]|uniref:Zinc ribbon domain-containing protein n=1 Tax=Paraconexibacter sp. AEG42_29 TaxID=2997339 RepID=A0AAU7AY84_9ACTN
MTSRLSKLRPRRSGTPSAADAPGPADAAPEQPTHAQPAVGPTTLFADPAGEATPAPLPADTTAAQEAQPSFRDRGQFRRRLRYLRRVRELGFRDLGGLVFDLHRFQQPGEQLIAGKLAALAAVDRELRALERVMKDEQDFTDLREPGIAACARCGALHGSDARFCPSCGISLTGPRTLSELPVVATAAPSAAAPVASEAAPLTWDFPSTPASSADPSPDAGTTAAATAAAPGAGSAADRPVAAPETAEAPVVDPEPSPAASSTDRPIVAGPADAADPDAASRADQATGTGPAVSGPDTRPADPDSQTTAVLPALDDASGDLTPPAAAKPKPKPKPAKTPPRGARRKPPAKPAPATAPDGPAGDPPSAPAGVAPAPGEAPVPADPGSAPVPGAAPAPADVPPSRADGPPVPPPPAPPPPPGGGANRS